MATVEEQLDKLVQSYKDGDNVWLNDAYTFATKYLKGHSLYQTINTAHFQKNYVELYSCLQSVQHDADFMAEADGIKTIAVPSYKAKELPEYDVFISHADKDKPAIVDDLVKSINLLGLNVFYDKETLEWGDKWKDKILDGVKKSEFAIIVISENFFGREWTEKELNSFLNRQNSDGQKIVLPVLYNISLQQLRNRYPAVAEIQALNAGSYSTDQIALMFAKQYIKRLKSLM